MNQEVEVNEQIIIVAAIDADGCALHKNKKGTVVGKNAPLIEHVVATHHTYAETKPKSVKLNGYVTIISNRQSENLDKMNAQRNNNGSFFPAIQDIHKKLKRRVKSFATLKLFY